MSRHRRFYKYSLINSVRHLSGFHPNLLLTVLPSQSRTEGMVLYSLGRSPCSRLSLQWQPAAVERHVSSLLSPWLFPFPDMPALFTQMSSTEGKGGVKESGEMCLLFFVCGVHTPQVAPAVKECVWVCICRHTWSVGGCGGSSLLLSIAFLVHRAPDAAAGENGPFRLLSAPGRYVPENHIGPRGHILVMGCFVGDKGVIAFFPGFWIWWRGRNWLKFMKRKTCWAYLQQKGPLLSITPYRHRPSYAGADASLTSHGHSSTCPYSHKSQLSTLKLGGGSPKSMSLKSGGDKKLPAAPLAPTQVCCWPWDGSPSTGTTFPLLGCSTWVTGRSLASHSFKAALQSSTSTSFHSVPPIWEGWADKKSQSKPPFEKEGVLKEFSIFAVFFLLVVVWVFFFLSHFLRKLTTNFNVDFRTACSAQFWQRNLGNCREMNL